MRKVGVRSRSKNGRVGISSVQRLLPGHQAAGRGRSRCGFGRGEGSRKIQRAKGRVLNKMQTVGPEVFHTVIYGTDISGWENYGDAPVARAGTCWVGTERIVMQAECTGSSEELKQETSCDMFGAILQSVISIKWKLMFCWS